MIVRRREKNLFTKPEGSQSGRVLVLAIRKVLLRPTWRGPNFVIPEGTFFANPDGSYFRAFGGVLILSNRKGPNFANPEGSFFSNPEGSYFC